MTEKKDNAPPTVVFKFSWLCECEGCTMKIKKAVRSAEDFKVDWSAYELTVIGKVDPVKVLDNLKKEFPMKKVEIVPPQPKKDAGGGNKKKTDKKKSDDKKEQDKKAKEKELTKVKRVKEKVELIEVRQEVRQVTEIQVVKIRRELVVEGPK
ncbi:hypothetical protein QN277_010219 [Acacia crassicarpa]|uniref:HMA domain-containing protein n=1 Tax=Acacia crassicarpa TaxID=499986 RepID=A0AAE1IND8_9FABA|nr:hypothetical protein QN277_010219 [Acacia crassicarpa]